MNQQDDRAQLKPDPCAADADDGLASLPPALLTGHRELDAEHAMLLGMMRTLRDICTVQATYRNCATCSGAEQRRCDSDLVGMLGDLLAFILEHFRHEEEVMRTSLLLMLDREQCTAHMEDHAAISGKVQQIIARLDRLQTVVLIRELDALLQTWVDNHIALHDVLLARWMARQTLSADPV